VRRSEDILEDIVRADSRDGAGVRGFEPLITARRIASTRVEFSPRQAEMIAHIASAPLPPFARLEAISRA
jgi:hypothetical protein